MKLWKLVLNKSDSYRELFQNKNIFLQRLQVQRKSACQYLLKFFSQLCSVTRSQIILLVWLTCLHGNIITLVVGICQNDSWHWLFSALFLFNSTVRKQVKILLALGARGFWMDQVSSTDGLCHHRDDTLLLHEYLQNQRAHTGPQNLFTKPFFLCTVISKYNVIISLQVIIFYSEIKILMIIIVIRMIFEFLLILRSCNLHELSYLIKYIRNVYCNVHFIRVK